MRGRAGDFPLDENTIGIVGKSLARIFKERLGRNARFVIGRDTRESGEWIENAFCAGAVSGSAVCESAGIITTPGLAFVAKHFDFDAGIVVSASHNPFEDNGLKIFLPDGKKIDEATEREIEKEIYENAKVGKSKSKSLMIKSQNLPNFKMLISIIWQKGFRICRLKISKWSLIVPTVRLADLRRNFLKDSARKS